MIRLSKNENGAIPLLILLTVIGMILFFVVSATFPFKNNLFTSLYPKDSSYAASGIENPTRLAIVYVHPKDRYSGVEMSASDIAKKFNVVIYHRQFDNKILDMKNAGFKGEALQYIIHDETAGPLNMSAPWAQTTACSVAQKGFSPAWHQSITYKPGSFCEIHDSIVNKTPFDHDLNPSTPNIVATESWFLHDGGNNRIIQPEGMPNGAFYRVNPGNQHWREYFIAHALVELKGGTNQIKTNFDGVFLDNVQLSWRKLLRNTNNVYAKEYPTAGHATQFNDDVYNFVKEMYTAFHANGNNYPLWGNIIEGDNNGSQWDRYTSALDGGFLEDFVVDWGHGYHSDQTILNQFTQAEKWLAAGKDYVAVVQGNSTNGSHDQWGTFSLAAFLLITDGVNGSFHHASNATYGPHFDYPEYYYKLGKPLGPKKETSSNPRIFSRQFECGKVDLNLTAKTSSINVNPGCVPSTQTIMISLPARIDAASTAEASNGLVQSLVSSLSGNVNTWSADNGFIDGNTVNRGVIEIENTDEDRIYQTERWGLSGYRLAVPNGNYTVKLHFAETWAGINSAGQRVFSIQVENQSIPNLDVYAEAGGLNKALVKTVPITVIDGELNITFTKQLLETMISGIEVSSETLSTPVPTIIPTSVPTMVPTSLPTIEPTSSPSPLPTPIPTVLPTPLPTSVPTQIPTPIPTPIAHIMPSTPSIVKNVSCITQNYSGNGISISWASNVSKPVSWIDVATSPTFINFSHKKISSGTTTQFPTGFTIYNSSQSLTINPNVTYYVRLYNDSPTGGHSPITTFSMNECTQQGSTIKINAMGSKSKTGVYPNFQLRIDGAVVKTFKTTGVIQSYTHTTTAKVKASQIKVGFWEDDGPSDLRVDGITVDTVYYPSNSNSVYYYSPECGMNGFNNWKANTLWCNGDFSYR